MNAPVTIDTPVTAEAICSEANWSARWRKAKGTAFEDAALLSIADETSGRDIPDADLVHIYALDAVQSPADRDGFIQMLEEVFAEWDREDSIEDAEREASWRYTSRTGRVTPDTVIEAARARASESYVPGAVA